MLCLRFGLPLAAFYVLFLSRLLCAAVAIRVMFPVTVSCCCCCGYCCRLLFCLLLLLLFCLRGARRSVFFARTQDAPADAAACADTPLQIDMQSSLSSHEEQSGSQLLMTL